MITPDQERLAATAALAAEIVRGRAERALRGYVDHIVSATGEHHEDVKRVVCEFFMRRLTVPTTIQILDWRERERRGEIPVQALPKGCRECGAPTPLRRGSETRREKFCSGTNCRTEYYRKHPRRASDED